MSTPIHAMLFANTDWYLYNFRRSLAAALRDAGHQVLLVSPPGEYGARLQALGFRWLPAPMERLSLNPVKELALVRWLTQLVRREQIDLVQVHFRGSIAIHAIEFLNLSWSHTFPECWMLSQLMPHLLSLASLLL